MSGVGRALMKLTWCIIIIFNTLIVTGQLECQLISEWTKRNSKKYKLREKACVQTIVGFALLLVLWVQSSGIVKRSKQKSKQTHAQISFDTQLKPISFPEAAFLLFSTKDFDPADLDFDARRLWGRDWIETRKEKVLSCVHTRTEARL